MFTDKEIKDSITWRMKAVRKQARLRREYKKTIYIEKGARIMEMADKARVYEIMALATAQGWTFYGAMIDGTMCLIGDK